MKKIVVAIDGYSACGKSSTAKQVAQHLGYKFIDTGAMYRAVTLFFIRNGVIVEDLEEVERALDQCEIGFEGKTVLLNGENIDMEIRTQAVNNSVSQVSAISLVRKKMVVQQQEIGIEKGVVMDGRDIGTVVFPEAELKIFMTAEMDTRARRRQKELQMKGLDEDLESIKRNLAERDHVDSNRADSPLRKAEGAIEIDTTSMTLDQQIDQIVNLAKEIIYEN